MKYSREFNNPQSKYNKKILIKKAIEFRKMEVNIISEYESDEIHKNSGWIKVYIVNLKKLRIQKTPVKFQKIQGKFKKMQ